MAMVVGIHEDPIVRSTMQLIKEYFNLLSDQKSRSTSHTNNSPHVNAHNAYSTKSGQKLCRILITLPHHGQKSEDP